MYKISIKSTIGAVLENVYFMRPPNESQLNTVWIESIKRYGAFIVLHNEPTRYIELGL